MNYFSNIQLKKKILQNEELSLQEFVDIAEK